MEEAKELHTDSYCIQTYPRAGHCYPSLDFSEHLSTVEVPNGALLRGIGT